MTWPNARITIISIVELPCTTYTHFFFRLKYNSVISVLQEVVHLYLKLPFTSKRFCKVSSCKQ